MDCQDWSEVPRTVVKLARELREPARLVLAALRPVLSDTDRVYLHPQGEVWVETDSLDTKSAAWEALESGPWTHLMPAPVVPAPDDGQWICIKQAAPLGFIGDTMNALQAPLGGSRPLTSALVGGLLAGGLGYGAGRIAEKVLPEDYFEQGHLPRTLGVLGGLMGALPSTWWGAAKMRDPDPNVGGWQAWIKPEQKLSHWHNPEHMIDIHEKVAEDLTGWSVPTIPVDAFNRAIWNDVSQPPNPFGTKSPWGSNEQPLSTPPNVAATASGIVSGAGALTDSSHVSPLQVGLAAASAAGQGLVAGLAFGKTMGFLAGLKPDAQQKLQDLGLWGGALTGAVNALFRR